MFATISLIFLGLLYLSYMETRHFKAAIVACSFVTFLASVSFGPRTILFGYLYLVLLLIILQRFRQRERPAMVDSTAVLHLGEHPRLVVTGPDCLFDHYRRRFCGRELGTCVCGAMDTFANG